MIKHCLVFISLLVVIYFAYLKFLKDPTIKISDLPVEYQSIIVSTNDIRREAGCKDVRISSRLTEAAKKRAIMLNGQNNLNHRDFERVVRPVYLFGKLGENLAKDFSEIKVVTQWMNSTSHGENILNCQFRAMGIWKLRNIIVQEFGEY